MPEYADIPAPETAKAFATDGGAAHDDAPDGTPSIRADVERIALDVREFVTAEMRYYRLRLKYSKSIAKWTGAYLLVGLVSLFSAAIALILGCLMIAAFFLGPIWATVLVTVSFAIIGAVSIAMARRTGRKLRFADPEGLA